MMHLPEDSPSALSLEQQAQSTWNRLWFAWRRFRRHERPAYTEHAESKQQLFAERGDASHWESLEEDFRHHYGLEDCAKRTTKARYREILTYLDFLEQLLPEFDPKQPVSWLDVGAKNWAYVDALHAFVNTSKREQPFTLTGIEIDAYRLYPDWHSRLDYARHYSAPFPEARYIAGDMMTHHEPCSVVSWFLPFVFLNPCLSWGLPADCFQPLEQLRHVWGLLKPGGTLIIVNQGDVEFQEQRRLLDALAVVSPDVEIAWSGPLRESFVPYRHLRFGWRVVKGC